MSDDEDLPYQRLELPPLRASQSDPNHLGGSGLISKLPTRRALTASLLALPTAGCSPMEKRTRLRLTIEALVGGRSMTATSVMENGFTEAAPWWTGATSQTRYRGEAALLDLGKGRVLVAFLRNWSTPTDAPRFLRPDGGWMAATGRVSMPARWPVMGVFSNRLRPESLRLLPASYADGDLLKVTGVTADVSTDRIFTGLPERTFPWLEGIARTTPWSIRGAADPGNDPDSVPEDFIGVKDIVQRNMNF